MSAKHKRPFYVFAAVATICAMVLVSGLRASRADDGAQLIARSPQAGTQSTISQLGATIAPSRSPREFPGTDEDAPGGDPEQMSPARRGVEPSDAGTGVEDPRISGARDVDSPLLAGLELPDLDEEGVDLDDLPSVEDVVRSAGEIRRGPKDEKKDKDEKDKTDKDESEDDGTDEAESDSNVDPTSEGEDEEPGDGSTDGPGVEGQGTETPDAPEQQP